jgi:lipopolysaccharide assembly protein A
MRVLIAVVVVASLLLGVVFGALNTQSVRYDFLFAHFEISKGVAALAALLIGWLLGGALCWAGSAPARRRGARKPADDERA